MRYHAALRQAARLLFAVVVVFYLALACVARTHEPAPEQPVPPGGHTAPAPVPQPAAGPPAHVEMKDEAAFFDEAAQAAWRQFDRLWNRHTGLAAATPDYARITPWDIGSILAANYSAHGLGLIDDETYRDRMAVTLHTLEHMPLYRHAVFHKMYLANSAQMAGKNGRPTRTGYGWSATDLGRLLNWLRIIAQKDPQFRPDIARIVGRINFDETTGGGYLFGGMIGSHGKLWRFQEGRIGYEQYSAEGFRYWGAHVQNALDLKLNARPITLLGVPLYADARGLDRLNGEPFVLMGIELGFTPEMQELARNVLAVQQARFEQTGKITMVSEDAVSVPPWYFYYYCVLCNGRSFTVDVADPGKHLDNPRWVSTKASFGFHVLMGTDYTRRVMESIRPALSARGWSSGVFETTDKSTNTYDVNTAAVVLEAALYRKLGHPLVQ